MKQGMRQNQLPKRARFQQETKLPKLLMMAQSTKMKRLRFQAQITRYGSKQRSINMSVLNNIGELPHR